MKESVLDLTINLQLKEEEVFIGFADKKIGVKGYIPVEEKYKLINWVLSQSRRNLTTNFLSQIDVNKKFDIAIVNAYTNYKFDIINKDLYNETYDILNTNHFFDLVISAIPENEYNELSELLQQELNKDEKYCLSIAGNINRLIDKINHNLENVDKVMDNLQNFDVTKYENLAFIADKLGKNNDKPNKTISLVEQKEKEKQ